MRCRTLVSLILAASAAVVPSFAQTSAPAPKPPQSMPQPPGMPGMGAPPPDTKAQEQAAASLPDNAVVIFLEGVCANPAAQGSTCRTEITKAEFEKLAHALDPNPTAAMRQSLADNYVKVFTMAQQAENHGVPNDERAKEVLRFVRLQALATLYNQRLQEDAKKVPADEAQKYYDAHKTDYEEFQLRRVFVLRNVPADAKKLSDAELTALANDLQKRAKAGEDFNVLQKDAYDKEGMKTPPPPTDLGAQRRSNFPPDQAGAITKVQAGDVSEVINDPVGLMIYKVVSRRVISLDEAKPDIERTMQAQRYQDELGKVFSNVKPVLNPQYFGPGGAIQLPGVKNEIGTPAQPKPPTK